MIFAAAWMVSLEFRSTPPRPAVEERDDAALLETLCLALRDVGIFNAQLPDGGDAREAIARVKSVYAETDRRGLDAGRRIERLSRETSWDMSSLLRDTLAYPRAIPYLASADDPLCGSCASPISRKAVLALCERCLVSGLVAVTSGSANGHLDRCTICERPGKGFVVYAHASEWMSYCTACLDEECSRRRSE